MDAKTASRLIGYHPQLVEEARKVAPALAARAAPLSEEELLFKLVELAPVFGIANRAPGEWAGFFGLYLDALVVLPGEAFDAAIVEWNQTGAPFLPKPSDIFRLAEPTAARLRMAAYRAKVAAEYSEAHPREKTAEERAADRQKAIDAGILDENGKVILNFKTDEARRVPGGETKHEAAERIRRVAAELEAQVAPPASPPAEDEETV